MNEKIKKLAEQAGLKTELWNNPEPFVIYKEDANNPGGLEKFAELIVKECIMIAKASHINSSDRKHTEGWNAAGVFISDNIEEYFGVKE